MTPPIKKYSLPQNLSMDRSTGRYRFRNPLTKKFTWVGRDRIKAIELAKKANNAIEIQKTQTLLDKSGAANLSYVISLYIENEVPGKPWKDTTKKNRLRTLEVFRREFGHRTIQGIDRVFLGDWLHDRCKTGDCHNKHRELLIDIWSFAISRKILDSNEAEKTRRRSNSKKIRANQKKRKRLTVEQFWDIHTSAEPWLQTAMELSLITLQARAEIIKLKYSDLRNGKIYIIREKVAAESEMAFIAIKETSETKKLIQRSRSDGIACPFVIHRKPRNKRPQHLANKSHWAAVMPEYLSKAFAKARKASGQFDGWKPAELPGFHEIRSLGARIYRELGYSERYIQSLMTHGNSKTTRIYLENPNHLEDSQFNEVEADLNLKGIPKI